MLAQLNERIKAQVQNLNMATHSYAELRSMNVEELNDNNVDIIFLGLEKIR